MIPVIIPYSTTMNSDVSLRYALRSLEKCITGIGEVIIVGDKPGFDYQNLTILECSNAYHNDAMRDANQYYKLKLGFEQIRSPRALLMHDDNFFLMYSDAKDWPWYYTDWPRLEGGLYKAVVENTRTVTNLNLPYSDLHCAHVVSKAAFGSLADLKWNVKPGYCIKTMCYNGEEVTRVDDLKLSAYYSVEEIRAMIKDRPWFSANDNAFNGGGLVKVLGELYMEKSIYEA